MSLNDPRWGNQPEEPEKDTEEQKRPANGHDARTGRGGQNPDEPPDLEEVWRDFNQRLQGMLGNARRGNNRAGDRRALPPGGGNHGGAGNGDDSGGFPATPALGSTIALVLMVGLAVWLASGFYTVNANERAIVMRFGKAVDTVTPGLHWHFPYPIEHHEFVALSDVRTVEIGYRGDSGSKPNLREALMITGDRNIINIQFAVQYVVKNPEDYLFRNRAPEESVKQVAESAMREIVGRSTMDFVLYEGRDQIAVSAQSLIQDMLDRYNTGIEVSRVTMQNAQPPEQVQAAFDDAVKAGQDLERMRNEGEAYANKIVPIAKGEAARLLEQAKGYSARVVANAEGEAARFTSVLAAYRNAPTVTRERMYLDTMQQVLSSTSKVVVGAQGNNNLTVLPLERLFGAANANVTAPTPVDSMAAASPPPSAPPPVAANEGNNTRRSNSGADYRNRDLARDRYESQSGGR